MRERTIDYQDEDYDVVIVLTPATVLQGAQRAVILGMQYGRFRTDETITLQERAVATITYPACLSCVKSIENRDPDKAKQLMGDIPLSEFLVLPDALVQQWERFAYELNPQWIPRTGEPTDEQGEVKESSSANG